VTEVRVRSIALPSRSGQLHGLYARRDGRARAVELRGSG
jgi:hypothetical protein